MAKNQGASGPNISEIDDDISDVVGKRVYYQLTDDEVRPDGGSRKVAAIVAQVYSPEKRNGAGQIVDNLFVMVNGGFNKDAARDDSRQPGTWALYTSGDSTN